MRSELKRTIQIAIPLIIANLVQMIMGIIDSAMVGRISSDLLAASSLVNSVVMIPFVLGMGLTMAVAPLIAAGLSSEDPKLPTKILYNAVIICGTFSVVIALFIALFSGFLFSMGQDPIVAALAKPYLQIIGWSLIPMLLFLTIKQFADGMEMTKLPMLISLYTIPVNIILNYLLIYGKWGFPRMELEGAGIATLITRVILFLAMAYLLIKSKKTAFYFAEWRAGFIPDKKVMRRILAIGIPSSLQHGMESWAFSISGIIIGWLGATALAAHQIALSLASFTFMIALGISGAGAIRIGLNYGRGDWEKVDTIGKGIYFLAFTMGILGALAFIFLKVPLIGIFNKEQEVFYLAGILLLYAAIFQISDAVQAIAIGLLRGLQDVKVPTFFIGIAYWVIGIPSGYFLAFHMNMGAEGIWIGLVMGLSVNAFLLSLRFFRIVKRKTQGNQIL